MKYLTFSVLSFVLLLSGCSNTLRTNRVEGNVTFDGKPLAGANIAFTAAEEGKGHSAYAFTDENGFYQLQTHLGKANAGTTAGKYIVTVSKRVPIPTGKKIIDDEGNTAVELDGKELVPAIYTEVETTPLFAEVVKGKNTFNFELKIK